MSRVGEAGDGDLFGAPASAPRYPHGPGHRGVATSVIAAASMLPHLGAVQQKILDFLTECGARGATYTEIMAGCQLGAPTVCGRMVELVAAKLVGIHGTRPSASGRPARVYFAAAFMPKDTSNVA